MDHFSELKIEASSPSPSDDENSADSNDNYNSITHTWSDEKVKGCGLKTSAFDNSAFSPDDQSQPAPMENGDTNPGFVHGAVEDYDPHNFCNTDNPTSFWGTVIHVIIISAGPAILSIPVTCVGVGYVVALVIIPLIVCIFTYNMHMLVWCEYTISKLKRVPSLTYAEVVYHAFRMGPSGVRWFAPYGKVLSYVVFVIIWFFSCSYTCIIVAQNLQILSQNVLHYSIDSQTLLVVLTLPFLLLSWIRKLNVLVPFSFLGNVFNWFTFVLVIYYIIVDPSPWNLPPAYGHLGGLSLFAGTVLFNVNATGIVIPLKDDMKDRRKFNKRGGVLQISYIPVSVLYTSFSLACYLKYGSHLQDSVIDNLPKGAMLAQVGILLSTVALVIQYPLLMYVTFDVIWNNILKKKRESMKNQLFWEYVLRTALVALSLVVSIADPNIPLFLSLGGTIGSSIDSTILPACVQTLVMWKVCKSRSKFLIVLLKNSLLLILALFLAAGGILDLIKQIKAITL